MEDAITAKFGV